MIRITGLEVAGLEKEYVGKRGKTALFQTFLNDGSHGMVLARTGYFHKVNLKAKRPHGRV